MHKVLRKPNIDYRCIKNRSKLISRTCFFIYETFNKQRHKSIAKNNSDYIPEATFINVTINKLYPFVPNFIPTPEAQVKFNKPMRNSSTLSFGFSTTRRRIDNTGVEYQLGIGSSLKQNSRKHLIAANQTADRAGPANKTITVLYFDHVDVRKNHVEKSCLE